MEYSIWQPLEIKLNFIFWTNPNLPNGDLGNFNPNYGPDIQFLDALEVEMNRRISELVDPGAPCSDNYIPDAKFKFDIQRYWISDAYLWDLENQGTGNDNYCPGDWDDNNMGTPYTNQVYQRLSENNVREGVNVFFANEGSKYQQLITSQIITPGPADFCQFASCTDCSEYPSSDLMQKLRVAMNNEYLVYKYGRDILPLHDPNYIWDQEQRKLGMSRVILHELGHSFSLGHVTAVASCPNRNIMSTSHLSQGNYLNIGQVGRMHRISHLLSMRKYVSCREPSQSHDPLSELPRVVTGEETWDFDTKLYTHLIIESGGELTLCGRLYMPKNGYIWVKRGGKLTVDGGLISFNRQEFEDCPNEFWAGIIIQGNANKAHASVDINNLTPDDPGVAILQNNALIEYARTALSTKHSAQYWWFKDYFGGIVQATDATFLNCGRAAEFLKYSWPNASFFRKCRFESTDGSAYAGVTMWRTQGITFDECEFLNLGNYCLEFSNAGGNVLNGCTFRSTLNGIYAAATMPLSSPVVVGSASLNAQRNSFTQNSCAINGIGLSRLIVQNNDFSVNGHGVSLNGQSGYFSFNNTFTGHDVSEQFTLTGPLEKFTNCNDFLSENFGMLIQGDNEGFVFNNNELDAEYGLLVLDYNASPGRIFKIQSQFGNLDGPADNLFPENGTDIFTGNNTIPFIYIYRPDSDPRLIPACALNDPNCSQQFNYYSFLAAQIPPLNPCVDIEGFEECTTRSCLEERYARLDSLSALLDGGDKPALLNAIQTAPSSVATYQSLDLASPYLSDEVLSAMLGSAMQTPAKESILEANAPLSGQIMEEAESIISPSKYASLEAIKDTIPQSPRDELYANIQLAEQTKDRALHTLALQLEEEGDYETAEELLLQEGTHDALAGRMALNIRAGNFSKAEALLDSMPQITPRQQAFHFLMSLNLQMTASDSIILSPAQEQALYDIAESNFPESGYAKGMLSFLKGAVFMPNVPEVPVEPRSIEQGIEPEAPPSGNHEVSIFPNPAREQVIVQFNAPLLQAGELWVTSLFGRLVERRVLETGLSSVELDTRHFTPGSYLLTISRGGERMGPFKFMIIH
ncbi:MAG: right-handed parallel beta-helix repeat-containing protein [Lewinellaceae bacterium]|nr:right-handed parallel beta-helix repeat-containing protein [Lewinellaceae bacterium]